MAARGEAEASAKRAQRNVVLTASIAGLGGGHDGELDLQLPRLAHLPAADRRAGRSGTFFFYAAIGLLTLWFCWKLVPETKGKHLEEIEAIFKQRAESSMAKPSAGKP